jgi:D-lactate dehydrogenase (cytochrome)
LLTWLVVILLYNEVERKLAEDCVHRMVKRAVEMEGTVTVGRLTTSFSQRPLALLTDFLFQGEHGVGLVKRDYLPHELGETTVDAMRRVRNPFPLSKMVTGPLTTNPTV